MLLLSVPAVFLCVSIGVCQQYATIFHTSFVVRTHTLCLDVFDQLRRQARVAADNWVRISCKYTPRLIS